MIKDNYYNFLIVRKNINGVKIDDEMPIINKTIIENYKKDNIKFVNFKNINYVANKEKTIISLFNYDSVLNSLRNNPLKNVAKFKEFLAVCSPDFSIYPDMNRYELEHNVFKSRWLGSLWQHMGVNVIPTISWGEPSTYDICFKGIEKGGCVAISTIGVMKNYDTFCKGYIELKKRINPSLIIVLGKMLPCMEGDILLYELKETFNPRKDDAKLTLFDMNNYIEVKKGDDYGW